MRAEVARRFDAMAEEYEVLEPWYEHFYATLHALLRAALAPPRGARRRALDAGCGTGFQAAILQELGYTTHGVDVAGRLLARARCRLPGLPLVQGALEALPYAPASFDAVVCCGSTLSFVADPAGVLGELARVLRPGGRLLLDCEHRWSLDLAWAWLSALVGDPLGYGVGVGEAWRALTRVPRAGCWVRYPGYGRLRLYTAAEIRRLLAGAGLTPLAAWGVHGVTNAIPSTVLHRERLGAGLAALYRALCRLDRLLAGRGAGRALASSLVVLAGRSPAAGLQCGAHEDP